MGLKKVLIPKGNLKDVLLEDRYIGKIEIIPVETLADVLQHALVGKKKDALIKRLASAIPKNTPASLPTSAGGAPA